MNEKKADRRVRKTKALLCNALTKLLMEKELREISVMELTELADVNRGTFYLHYRDIYDLYEHIENNVLENFKSLLMYDSTKGEKLVIYSVVLWAFRFIADNAEMCMAILKQGDRAFLEKMFDLCRDKSLEEWISKRGHSSVKFHDYYFSFATSGCVGLVQAWLAGGMKEDPENMANMANKLIMGCLHSVNNTVGHS
ncbi:MAG TPA: TetR/AcrR family transcriptional regulator [Clostridiales bacterium]|nr:TetR/AcrR family transcriptional regulator [Clostridiales bacterium]